nr:MAG TPA: hypothetical protein [Caudoviricetes sp.]
MFCLSYSLHNAINSTCAPPPFRLSVPALRTVFTRRLGTQWTLSALCPLFSFQSTIRSGSRRPL